MKDGNCLPLTTSTLIGLLNRNLLLAIFSNFSLRQEYVQFAVVTSKEAYDSCDITLDGGALLITEGSYQRTLTSSGEFYFFCTIGTHCDLGLKFPANVVSPTPVPDPSPALAPSPDWLGFT